MHACLPIFSPSFLIIKMHTLCFFLYVSISGRVNNIKIICSIRFSLFITIDRFYKLFLAEGAFVNRRPEMISPLFHHARTLSGSLRSPPSPRGEGFVSGIPLPPIQPPPLRGTSFRRKEGVHLSTKIGHETKKIRHKN